MVLLDEWIDSKDTVHKATPSSTSPDPIDDEIVQQFRNLDVEASLFVDTGIGTSSRLLRYEKRYDIMSMPQTFNNVSEARLYLEIIVQRTRKFIRDLRSDKRLRRSPFYGLETTPDCGIYVIDDPLSLSHVRLTHHSTQPHGLLGYALERPWTITSTSRLQQESYASENRRWTAAFTPLLLSFQIGDEEYLGARILKLQSLALTINLAGCLCLLELISDSLLSQFTQIVSLAKSYLSHPRTSEFLTEGSFSLTTGLIYPLQLVIDKCRDRKLRREALNLLKSKPWREGSWSSSATAQIGTWFMETEEKGVETEWIPEQARLRL